MTIAIHGIWTVDESAFGLGGLNSHDADIAAAFRQEVDPGEEVLGGADETVEDSHLADIRAGYDHLHAIGGECRRPCIPLVRSGSGGCRCGRVAPPARSGAPGNSR